MQEFRGAGGRLVRAATHKTARKPSALFTVGTSETREPHLLPASSETVPAPLTPATASSTVRDAISATAASATYRAATQALTPCLRGGTAVQATSQHRGKDTATTGAHRLARKDGAGRAAASTRIFGAAPRLLSPHHRNAGSQSLPTLPPATEVGWQARQQGTT